MGIYSEKLNQILGSDHIKLYDMFIKGVKDNNIKLNNPEVTLYMIIEFTSSTLFSVFNRRIGLTIDEYKPYLHRVIKGMLSNGY